MPSHRTPVLVVACERGKAGSRITLSRKVRFGDAPGRKRYVIPLTWDKEHILDVLVLMFPRHDFEWSTECVSTCSKLYYLNGNKRIAQGTGYKPRSIPRSVFECPDAYRQEVLRRL
ncbi:hypothetical protein [Microcystis phage Mvi-JY20]|uniref:Uncharacterized protein n=1 Tax=Microcystis phage Mvi-JY20 TaxID=3128146 RepID=A0AAX4QHP9_9CAUD